MSDEAHIESAYRHADPTMRQQWHGLAPDEELMAREDAEEVDGREEAREEEFRLRAGLQQKFLVFCFADTKPEEWRTVAVRAHAVLRKGFAAAFAERRDDELPELREAAREVVGFPLEDLLREMLPHRRSFVRVLLYYFPDQREWLKHGVMNLYLIARNYQPGLVTRWDGVELSYDRLAAVFGEIPSVPAGMAAAGWIPQGWSRERWKIARDRARSRWSARAQQLIVRPIEKARGQAPAMFGKGAGVRGKYQAAAMGNQNRRKER